MSEADNVVIMPVVTRWDIPAERVLRAALEAGLSQVIVIGRLPAPEGAPTMDGEEYMASSIADGPQVVWLLERCKHRLLQAEDGE